VYVWLVIRYDEWCEADAKKDGCEGETEGSKLLRVEREKNFAFLLGLLAFGASSRVVITNTQYGTHHHRSQ